jgi:hypothetical protein
MPTKCVLLRCTHVLQRERKANYYYLGPTIHPFSASRPFRPLGGSLEESLLVPKIFANVSGHAIFPRSADTVLVRIESSKRLTPG